MQSITRHAIGMCLLAACASCAQVPPDYSELEALRADINSLHESIVMAESAQLSVGTLNEQASEQVASEIADLTDQVALLGTQVEATCRQAPAAPKCEGNGESTRRVTVNDDKMVLGEVEHVWIDPPGANTTARIDSGAASSSLHAENVTEFERDGADWVRFDVLINDVETTIERPVEKYVRVYQQSDKEGTRRAVVDMRIFIGDLQETFEFTLADRSHLEQGVILGRNFLTDIAIVDVSKQYVQPAYERPTPKKKN